jgi:hypothetical protein
MNFPSHCSSDTVTASIIEEAEVRVGNIQTEPGQFSPISIPTWTDLLDFLH